MAQKPYEFNAPNIQSVCLSASKLAHVVTSKLAPVASSKLANVASSTLANVASSTLANVATSKSANVATSKSANVGTCCTYAFIAIVRSSHFGFKFLFLKLPEFCSTMEKADILKIPPLAEIAVTKNNENYWIPEEEDYYWYCRPCVKIARCPFSPCRHPVTKEDQRCCSAKSWHAAQVWSLCDANSAIGYLMHHGIYSDFHGMDRQTCYDTIQALWPDIEWVYYDDTFDMRQHYRNAIRLQKAKSQAAPPKDKKRKIADQTDDMVSSHLVTMIVGQTLQQVGFGGAGRGSPSSSSHEPWAEFPPRPPIAAPNSLIDLTADSSAGARTLSLGAETVTIPQENLKLMQESLQRSEHAISSSLAHTVEQAHKLTIERLIVINALDVISSFTGVPTSHFKYGGK